MTMQEQQAGMMAGQRAMLTYLLTVVRRLAPEEADADVIQSAIDAMSMSVAPTLKDIAQPHAGNILEAAKTEIRTIMTARYVPPAHA